MYKRQDEAIRKDDESRNEQDIIRVLEWLKCALTRIIDDAEKQSVTRQEPDPSVVFPEMDILSHGEYHKPQSVTKKVGTGSTTKAVTLTPDE